jgi:hypothetical protein
MIFLQKKNFLDNHFFFELSPNENCFSSDFITDTIKRCLMIIEKLVFKKQLFLKLILNQKHIYVKKVRFVKIVTVLTR